jgi:hypothetical protein
MSYRFTAPSTGRYPWQVYWDSCFTAIAWRGERLVILAACGERIRGAVHDAVRAADVCFCVGASCDSRAGLGAGVMVAI